MAKLIFLTQGKYSIVDDEDFEKINQYKWWCRPYNNGNERAVGRVKGKSIFMHRFILNPPKDIGIDHIDHNGLNNRRENLRLATPSQNQANSYGKRFGKYSKFKGVTFNKIGGWQAQIGKNNKMIYLGCFSKEEDAARAYNKAAIKLFGEFAYLNKIEFAP